VSPPGLVAALAERGETLAVAESLTGGALAAAVVDVPGASAVLRGGVVSYATDLKHTLLGVDTALLAAEGAVHPQVALQMADGVRERLAATWGLATTGVAGPQPQDGQPPGTVFVALTGPGVRRVERLQLPGGRAQVRAAAVRGALLLLTDALAPVQPRA
jgi:nicotinamide-nucleotide amidase